VDARVVDGVLADAGIPAIAGFIHLILLTCLSELTSDVPIAAGVSAVACLCCREWNFV